MQTNVCDDNDFTDLHDRLQIGIRTDVSDDLFWVRSEACLECLDRFAEEVDHRDVGRGAAESIAGEIWAVRTLAGCRIAI